MIVSVQVNSRVNADLNVSHRTEIIANTEEEALEAGKEFWKMMVAFNNGVSQGAEEE